MEKVFAEVKRQTGYVVVGDYSLIQSAKPVTVNAVNPPLEEFIKEVLKNQEFSYTIKNTTISIKEKRTIEKKKLVVSLFEEVPPVIGFVRGSDGKPIGGVNIMIKGSNKGTTSDNNGKFSINANIGDVLILSSVGFGKKEVKVNSQGEDLSVLMEVSTSKLDEVQIIAYGTTSQRLATGNIASVTAKDIEKQPINNPLLALQGRVPGLSIVQETGLPGGGVKVRIQGQNSIINGSAPLFVVDGVPFPLALPPGNGLGPLGHSGELEGGMYNVSGNALTYLNPADIERIDVLKDADATAIYGSRAANGAILITTKKEKLGKPVLILTCKLGGVKCLDS